MDHPGCDNLCRSLKNLVADFRARPAASSSERGRETRKREIASISRLARVCGDLPDSSFGAGYAPDLEVRTGRLRSCRLVARGVLHRQWTAFQPTFGSIDRQHANRLETLRWPFPRLELQDAFIGLCATVQMPITTGEEHERCSGPLLEEHRAGRRIRKGDRLLEHRDHDRLGSTCRDQEDGRLRADGPIRPGVRHLPAHQDSPTRRIHHRRRCRWGDRRPGPQREVPGLGQQD